MLIIYDKNNNNKIVRQCQSPNAAALTLANVAPGWSVDDYGTATIDDSTTNYANGRYRWNGSSVELLTLTIAEKQAIIRPQRDTRLKNCDYVIQRDNDQVENNDTRKITTGQRTAWLIYRQALRDFPATTDFVGFDENASPDFGLVWPTTP